MGFIFATQKTMQKQVPLERPQQQNEKVEEKRRKNAPFDAYGKFGIVPKIAKDSDSGSQFWDLEP